MSMKKNNLFDATLSNDLIQLYFDFYKFLKRKQL